MEKKLFFTLLTCGSLLLSTWSCSDEPGSNDGYNALSFLTQTIEETQLERMDGFVLLSDDQTVINAFNTYSQNPTSPNYLEIENSVSTSSGESLLINLPYLNRREITTYKSSENEGVVYFHHYKYENGQTIHKTNESGEYYADIEFSKIGLTEGSDLFFSFQYRAKDSSSYEFSKDVKGKIDRVISN